MIEYKTKSGSTLKIYDETMPRINELKFHTHLSLEYGVGSDMNAVVGHYNKLAMWISQNKVEEAHQELRNLIINHQSLIHEVNHESRAFASIIYSIDDDVNNDLSDDGLDHFIEKLPKIQSSEVKEIIGMVKKNLKMN